MDIHVDSFIKTYNIEISRLEAEMNACKDEDERSRLNQEICQRKEALLKLLRENSNYRFGS